MRWSGSRFPSPLSYRAPIVRLSQALQSAGRVLPDIPDRLSRGGGGDPVPLANAKLPIHRGRFFPSVSPAGLADQRRESCRNRYRNMFRYVPVAGLASPGQARRRRRGGLVAVARIAAHGGEAGRPLRPGPAALVRAVRVAPGVGPSQRAIGDRLMRATILDPVGLCDLVGLVAGVED